MNRTAHASHGNETLLSRAESELDAVRKIGTRSMKEAERFAKEALDDASAEIVSLEKKASAFIRKNPYLVVGAAVAVGFVIAKLIRRPRSNA